MPCLIGCLALSMPRLAVLLVAIFTQYLHRAYDAWVWPVLGFFFLPLTTLAYAWAVNEHGGTVRGFPLAVVVIAVLADLGVLTGGAAKRKGVRNYWRR
jgi:hypothetical protein